MFHRDNDTDRRVDPELIELPPSAWRCVAGGSPTLPLPPPAALSPDPVPWAKAFLW